MSTITIEAEPDTAVRTCEECGGENHRLTGWVYADGDASGVYILEWCEGPDSDRSAQLTLGLGPFGEGTDADGRAAFCIAWSESGMTLTDVPSRDNPDLLGVFVPRDEALQRSDISSVWHVADHIVLDDPRVADAERWIRAV